MLFSSPSLSSDGNGYKSAAHGELKTNHYGSQFYIDHTVKLKIKEDELPRETTSDVI